MQRLSQDPEETGRTGTYRSRRGERDEPAETEQEQHLLERAVHAGEEHRDDDDRPELARHTRAEHGGAERRREQSSVGEDRNECAERGGAQSDPEQPPFDIEARLAQQHADAEADRQRDRPAARAHHDGAPRDALLDDLDPGEEEEHREPEVGKERDVRVDLGEVEALRADDDSEDDLDDDGGQHDPPVEPGRDRADRRSSQDEDERAEVRARNRSAHDRREEPVHG